jgi:hypothetical protein
MSIAYQSVAARIVPAPWLRRVLIGGSRRSISPLLISAAFG